MTAKPCKDFPGLDGTLTFWITVYRVPEDIRRPIQPRRQGPPTSICPLLDTHKIIRYVPKIRRSLLHSKSLRDFRCFAPLIPGEPLRVDPEGSGNWIHVTANNGIRHVVSLSLSSSIFSTVRGHPECRIPGKPRSSTPIFAVAGMRSLASEIYSTRAIYHYLQNHQRVLFPGLSQGHASLDKDRPQWSLLKRTTQSS